MVDSAGAGDVTCETLQIHKPSSSQTLEKTQAGGSSATSPPISQVTATKQTSYIIKKADGDQNCCVYGMAITKNMEILVADYNNENVKLFSPDMKFLSSVLVPHNPTDVAVAGENKAVVVMYNKLAILDTSGKQLSILEKRNRPCAVRAITSYRDKFVVTCPYGSPTVRLIDDTGRVFWSIKGRHFFQGPKGVSCHSNGALATVVVTDAVKNTLTLLKAETGEVISTRFLGDRRFLSSVAYDHAGNIYVSCDWTKEVSVFSKDLSEEKVLVRNAAHASDAIVYDDRANQLLVAVRNKIHCYKLSL